MDTMTQIQIWEKAVSISDSANTLDQTIRPPSIWKIEGQAELFNLSMTTFRERKKTLNWNLFNSA